MIFRKKPCSSNINLPFEKWLIYAYELLDHATFTCQGAASAKLVYINMIIILEEK